MTEWRSTREEPHTRETVSTCPAPAQFTPQYGDQNIYNKNTNDISNSSLSLPNVVFRLHYFILNVFLHVFCYSSTVSNLWPHERTEYLLWS